MDAVFFHIQGMELVLQSFLRAELVEKEISGIVPGRLIFLSGIAQKSYKFYHVCIIIIRKHNYQAWR